MGEGERGYAVFFEGLGLIGAYRTREEADEKKAEVLASHVLRCLKGQPPGKLARELGVTVALFKDVCRRFIEAGTAGLREA